jgi:tRNA(Ile)-lysidine synthase TilS/MesJ
MKANYQIEAGDVRVIRPFIYVRETTTRDFSQQSKLPIINENCPACFEQPKVSSPFTRQYVNS